MSGDAEKTRAELIAELEVLRAQATDSNVATARDALSESEERYRIVTEVCRDAITVTNEAGEVIFVNPAHEAIFGLPVDDLVGTSLTSHFAVVHPDDVDRVTKEFNSVKEVGDTVYYSPMRCRHADGSWVWIKSITTSYRSTSGERYVMEIHQDISDAVEEEQRKKQLAEQMMESQRLEGLGVLAGGIAHDFNNLLTPILGDASLSMLDLPLDSPVRKRIERIHMAAHRAELLTDQMLTYSGQRHALIEPLDISRLVEEMAQLLEGAVSGKAELVYNLAEDLPAVEGDGAQLSQVVMNLITNATEAVSEGAGRTVLRTGEIEAEKINRDLLVGAAALDCDRYVFVEVTDNGCGMDSRTQSKIFDPFFTTKITGRGLGLAAVLGIVRSHRGVIEVDTQPGRGTCFRVLLPSTGTPLQEVATEKAFPENWRGSGTVLVADDDEAVRELVAETLKRAGLTVLLACDGSEAVEQFRRRPDEISLVVLDRTMPNVGGEEAFKQIRQIRADARIILMSGYSEQRAGQRLGERGPDEFLHKPFEPTALLERVRRIIEARSVTQDGSRDDVSESSPTS